MSEKHPVVHFDLTAQDPEAAIAFYRSVFGWEFQHLPEMDYWLVSTAPSDETGSPTEPGSINGGLSQGEPSGSGTVITIHVPDIDDALQRVEKAGGETAQERTSIGEHGWTAGFHDPAGNLVGLFQGP